MITTWKKCYHGYARLWVRISWCAILLVLFYMSHCYQHFTQGFIHEISRGKFMWWAGPINVHYIPFTLVYLISVSYCISCRSLTTLPTKKGTWPGQTGSVCTNSWKYERVVPSVDWHKDAYEYPWKWIGNNNFWYPSSYEQRLVTDYSFTEF